MLTIIIREKQHNKQQHSVLKNGRIRYLKNPVDFLDWTEETAGQFVSNNGTYQELPSKFVYINEEGERKEGKPPSPFNLS